MHFFLDLALLIGDVPSDLEHLLVALVHFDQVIGGSFVLDIQSGELLEGLFGVLEGDFINLNFSLDVVLDAGG